MQVGEYEDNSFTLKNKCLKGFFAACHPIKKVKTMIKSDVINNILLFQIIKAYLYPKVVQNFSLNRKCSLKACELSLCLFLNIYTCQTNIYLFLN